MASLVCDLSIEKTLNKTIDKLDNAQLINKINEQIKRYEKDVFVHLEEEESFNYKKLNLYIKAHLFDRVCACFNLPEMQQRILARRDLINAAYMEADASTYAQKKIVYHYIQIFLQIVENHYLEKVDDKELLLMGKTVDEILTFVKEYMNKTENRIIDAVQYRGSFAEYIDGLKPSPDNGNAFHYRNELLRFRGRQAELKSLKVFLDDQAELSWMAVTGAGGSGKSKLLYHFINEMRIYTDWKSVWLQMEDCAEIHRFTEWKYPYNLVFVVDYAGTVASEIGKWMKRLERSTYRPNKMRFILIEREGMERNDDSLYEPLWYKKLIGSGEQERCVKRLGYRGFDKTPFLKLSALSKRDLEKMIEDYAALYQKYLSPEKQMWIIEKAEEIDVRQDGIRPLIVLFITDTVIQKKEYTQGDISFLLDQIIERYEEHWKRALCQNNERIFSALKEMIMFSTAVGGWIIQEEPPKLFRNSVYILVSINADEFESFICAVNEENKYEGKLKPLQPDLIGEYYVLNYWTKKKYNNYYLDKLFNDLWNYPIYFAEFLNRCIQNHGTRKEFYDIFKNGLKRLYPIEKKKITNIIFARLLVNLINKQDPKNANETFYWLEEMYKQHGNNEELAIEYAKGLFNLSNKQDEAVANELILRLDKLNKKYEGNEEIALRYAQSLVNLLCKQNKTKEGAEQTICRLEELNRRYKGNEEIALRYAKGLFNLSNMQGEKEAKKTIYRLGEQSKRYERNEEIAIVYAQSLFNLLYGQNEEDAKETIQLLEILSRGHKKNEEIILAYAQGLLSLSNKQEEEDAKETVSCLEKLSENYRGNSEIALRYAKGLVNLLNKQNEEEAKKTINRLEELSKEYAGNEEIALRYAKGLFNLLGKQDEGGAEKTIRLLGEQCMKYKMVREWIEMFWVQTEENE